MRDLLAKLVELQRFDDALRDTRALQQRLQTLETENAGSREVFDRLLSERAARIDEVADFVKEKTEELSKIEEDARRTRSRMGAVSSQRELAAVNKEIDHQRRMGQSLTAELAKLREELAQAQADHATKRGERDALFAQMEALEHEVKAQLADKLTEAADIQARREALRATLPPQDRGRYDRIAKARQGKAVADVVDGCCTACKMQVPPRQHQKILRLEGLETCQSCQRMLIWFGGLSGDPLDAAGVFDQDR